MAMLDPTVDCEGLLLFASPMAGRWMGLLHWQMSRVHLEATYNIVAPFRKAVTVIDQ